MTERTEGHRPDSERVKRLMMEAVDREISAEGLAELNAALADRPELRAELEAFTRVKEVTDTMTRRPPPEEIWDGYWEGVYRRFERGVGWILTSIAAIVLLTWGAWEWSHEILATTTLPIFVRWSILAGAAGLVVLFVSVARERLFVSKGDPYKDVIR